MSSRTGIAWTDATWNPVRGCSRVSEGCRRCYAEVIAARFCGEPESPFYTFARQSPARWTGKVELVPEKLDEPLRWRKPRRVFVNSMSDLFHERLSFEDIAAVFGIMGAAPQHTFQILTKRPARAREFLRGEWCPRFGSLREHAFYSAANRVPALRRSGSSAWDREWPLSNVWLGTSVEDQKAADERIPVLLDTPAAVRFVSYEPALGPVSFDRGGWLRPTYSSCQQADSALIASVAKAVARTIGWAGLDWLIVGGESGPKARPMLTSWWVGAVRQCRAAGVAVFSKQGGSRLLDDAGFYWPAGVRDHVGETMVAPRRIQFRDRAGADPSEWPEDLRVRGFPEVRRG